MTINLDYIKNLTIWKDGMACPLVYATRDEYGVIYPVAAEGEGIGAVDDAARAAILFMKNHSPENDIFVSGYLKFLEYMMDDDGAIANFITDTSFAKNETGDTSYPGGQWWSVRARCAFSRAVHYKQYFGMQSYNRNEEEIERYTQLCLMLDEVLYEFDDESIKALYIISQVNLDQAQWLGAGHPNIHLLEYPVLDFDNGSFVHNHKGSWGYHQLEAAQLFNDKVAHIYTKQIGSTIKNYALELLKEEPKEDTCPYSYSSIIQGLGSNPYIQKKFIEKFDQIFDYNADGSCSDGKNSSNFGAEAAIEYGFIRLVEEGQNG